MTEKIKVSLCFHASDPEIARWQLSCMEQDLQSFEYSVRIRGNVHADAYPSFSELVNTAINDSPHERIVLLNDKVMPKQGDLTRMLTLLDAGFGYVGLYSVGFCALTKGIIKKIGWFDERFLGGGYEDDDFVMRMRMHDVAIFDSHECDYDYATTKTKQSVTIPLSGSEPHFLSKWRFEGNLIEKLLPEETYEKYDLSKATTDRWMPWMASVLGYYYGVGPKRGIPQGSHVTNHQGQSRVYRFCTVPYAGMLVGANRNIVDRSKEN